MLSTREMIIDAAKELFATQGFEAVSMSMIAKAISKNKATLYHYFESKELLYNEILKLYLSEFQVSIGKSTLPLPDAVDQIKAFIELLANMESSIARILYRQVLDANKHFSDEVLHLFEQQKKSFFAIYKSGITSGSLKMMDPTMIYEMIMGTTLRFNLLYNTNKTISSQQFCNDFSAVILPLISSK